MKQYAFGADIGGTTVKLGIFKTDGSLVAKWEIPTVTSDAGKAIIPDIAKSCKEKTAELGISLEDFCGIGAGVPGMVLPDGVVDQCVNLGWQKIDAKGELEAALGIPAAIGNDANVAALGEMWQGGGKGYSNVVMITLGTGVGSGIIVDGKIVAGAHGYGGEFGHITMNTEETAVCGCGRRGCLEQYCSATGIVRTTKNNLAFFDGETALKACEEVTAKDVFDAAKAGDLFALDQVADFAQVLGKGLSYISCITDPEVFVIGGGVSKAGEIITDAVKKAFANYAFGKQLDSKFVLASLGNDAGIYGCAKMVLNQ